VHSTVLSEGGGCSGRRNKSSHESLRIIFFDRTESTYIFIVIVIVIGIFIVIFIVIFVIRELTKERVGNTAAEAAATRFGR